MKVTYRVGNATIEVEGENQVEIFEQLAEQSELFAAARKCGVCKVIDAIPVKRVTDKGTFYEFACPCGAKLGVSRTQDGERLFARRKKGQDWLPNGGWQKWQDQQKQKKEESRNFGDANEDEIPL